MLYNEAKSLDLTASTIDLHGKTLHVGKTGGKTANNGPICKIVYASSKEGSCHTLLPILTENPRGENLLSTQQVNSSYLYSALRPFFFWQYT